MCSELPQCAASFYSKMWEVGAMLPLRQGWRWESSFQMWKVVVLSPDVGGGSCAATPTRCGRWESSLQMWEVGVVLPLRRGWRWESSFQLWKVGVLSPDVGGGSCAVTPTRWEVGVPQSNYKTTRHKLMFQSARFQERALNFQLHNFSGPRRSLVAPSDTERTVNSRFIGTRGRSDTAG